jgi:cytochrome P450
MPTDHLLTRLVHAEVDGERLTQDEIAAFVQLLLVAGNETTTKLLNNAILCLMENSDQLAPLGQRQNCCRRLSRRYCDFAPRCNGCFAPLRATWNWTA